ncbi:MAG: hypothetical protein CMB80_22435 [Flammeovirgaceae bacterium]|nr:hypothetical protein [Flammeovirgaceae bacterium]MBR09820.1 hypothetical protein [Rickettsiales bacterium]
MLQWVSKVLKIIVLVIFVAFGVLQFLGPNKPETTNRSPEDLTEVVELPNGIESMLVAACYDCHSMETKYPWYGSVAPVSWILFDHIEHGREELNFSYWKSMSKREKLRGLKDIQEVLEENEMPLDDYVKMHSEAELSADQKNELISWAKSLANQVISE